MDSDAVDTIIGWILAVTIIFGSSLGVYGCSQRQLLDSKTKCFVETKSDKCWEN